MLKPSYALAVGAGEISSSAPFAANRLGLVAAVAAVFLSVTFEYLGYAPPIGAGEVVALSAAVLPARLLGLVAAVPAVDVSIALAPPGDALAVGAAKVDVAASLTAARG